MKVCRQRQSQWNLGVDGCIDIVLLVIWLWPGQFFPGRLERNTSSRGSTDTEHTAISSNNTHLITFTPK